MTKGRKALLLVLRRTRVEFVAARCRVSPSAVYNWLSGRRRPSKDARMQLASNYAIEPNDWDRWLNFP